MRPINKQRIELIKRILSKNNKLYNHEIGDKLGISFRAVQWIRKRYGIFNRKKRPIEYYKTLCAVLNMESPNDLLIDKQIAEKMNEYGWKTNKDEVKYSRLKLNIPGGRRKRECKITRRHIYYLKGRKKWKPSEIL